MGHTLSGGGAGIPTQVQGAPVDATLSTAGTADNGERWSRRMSPETGTQAKSNLSAHQRDGGFQVQSEENENVNEEGGGEKLGICSTL